MFNESKQTVALANQTPGKEVWEVRFVNAMMTHSFKYILLHVVVDCVSLKDLHVYVSLGEIFRNTKTYS